MVFLHQDMGLLLSLPLSGNWGDSLGLPGGGGPRPAISVADTALS